jgi:predicted ATP-dependent serine protease
MAAPVVFVGREGELSRLLDALEGDARLVLVTGDAGVGKTRFVAEGMTRAAAAGAVLVRGSACRWPRRCRCCRSPRRWVS